MKTTNPKSKRQQITSRTSFGNRRRKASASDIAKRNGTASQDGAHSKLANVIAMLRTGDGAGIDQIMRATGWQRHTVRGVISGAIKRKLGLAVDSELRDGTRTYRIVSSSRRGQSK